MTPFTSLSGRAATLDTADIDTDVIFPARFLLLLDREGFDELLFHDLRKSAPKSKPFVLDRPEFRRAEILVTGPRFGIGSSREQAVWALSAFGIRCVIAPSFGDIFYNNCIKNGLLPAQVTADEHKKIMALAGSGAPLEIDLRAQSIRIGSETFTFSIDAQPRQVLLDGADDISANLACEAEIERFETTQAKRFPWMRLTAEHFQSLNISTNPRDYNDR